MISESSRGTRPELTPNSEAKGKSALAQSASAPRPIRLSPARRSRPSHGEEGGASSGSTSV